MFRRIDHAALVLTMVSFTLAIFLFSNFYVGASTINRVFRNVFYVPYHRVALVLGTSDYTRSGSPSPFFRSRISAAARLYKEHKCSYILASGDNAHMSYNEPMKMKQALKAEGVPGDVIFLDYAGFSTLDSMIRAKKVFGLDSCIVVSQQFQAQRAIFIADQAGMDVLAYAAADAPGMLGLNAELRELFARVKAFVDMTVLGTGPVFLGAPEVIE